MTEQILMRDSAPQELQRMKQSLQNTFFVLLTWTVNDYATCLWIALFVLIVLWIPRRGSQRTEDTHSFQHVSVLVDFHSMWNSMSWSVIFPQKSFALPHICYHVALTKNSGLIESVFCLEHYWQQKATEDFGYLCLPFHSPLSLHWQVLWAQYGERGKSSVYIQG